MVLWPKKYYKVICPDQTVKTVYKHVDDAFPLYIQGWKASVGVDLGKLMGDAGALQAEASKKIEGLVFSIGELNQSLMMQFRAAYVAFQSDPCGSSDFLRDQVAKLNHEQYRLTQLRLQVPLLVELARLAKWDQSQFMEAYKNAVLSLGDVTTPQTVALEINESIQIARQLGEATE